MSALALDVRPTGHGRQAPGVYDTAYGQGHPRARGFQVLSRIARSRASDDAYSPRHRLDTVVDDELRLVIA
jgi:hypothetical protein